MLRAASFVCLDAPLVALAWQALFAHVFATPLSAAARAALFFTTWGIYLLDRLADAASVRPGLPMSGRQRFARAHRRLGIAVLVLVAAIDLAMIARLSVALLLGGTAVGVVCAIYLTVNRRVDRTWRWIPVKELCIGGLFALGTVAALVPSIRAAGFVPSVALFGALCATNCAVIAVWERGLDVQQGKPSLATQTQLARHVPWILIGLAAIACASTAAGVPLAIAAPVAISALALAVLHSVHRSLPPDERTALADLVLLVPLLELVLR